MCTKIKEEIKTKKKTYAWKAVKVHEGVTKSPYYSFCEWKPNKTKATARKILNMNYNNYNMNAKVFHCFARRSDARMLKRYLEHDSNPFGLSNRPQYKVIKVELSGRTFKGTTKGLVTPLNGVPALCATKVFWDGKFSR